MEEPEELIIEADAIEVRDAAKREIDMRIVPWDTAIDTLNGREQFVRGAFDGTNADDVMLMGLEHEAHIGLGQDGSPRLVRRPVGRGIAIDPSIPQVTFRVAKTPAGDELLALAEDRIVRGVSVEFHEVPGGTVTKTVGGRRVRTHNRVRLTGASMTYRPAYAEAAITAVRSEEKKVPDQETQEANAAILNAIQEGFAAARAQMDEQNKDLIETYRARIEELELQHRAGFDVPTAPDEKKPSLSLGEWVKAVAGLMLGERLPAEQMRALDDVITTDNPGVVPTAHIAQVRGVIDQRRPFMESTRQLDMPDAGMDLTVPIINQRPLTAVQATEKTEVESRKTLIGLGSFDLVTIAGAGDLSIQIIRRSSPQFLGLWMELLGEAYAIEAEDQALQALFNATGGVGAGNPLNPNSLSLGAAFQTSFGAVRRPPDTLWLSTEAVAEFIDAKATTTNVPLYSTITTSATAAGGITGTISGLRVVHVPALDAHGAYAIVGPSSAFAWAEDGPLTLQADVPSLAGRDVALVGMAFFVPWYPDAFSLYNVAS